MKLLLVILAVMTWTVETKNTVSLDAASTKPPGTEVHYRNTGSKGSVTAKDTAILSLSHLGGIKIESAEVYVRSNKSAGSGVFTVDVNGKTVATKSGSRKNWVGTFDNTNYHAISLLSTVYEDVDTLVITLTGTENSLYIEKYVLNWSARPPCTVTMMRGSTEVGSMTQDYGGEGITLSALMDEENWRFIGWSEREFWTVYELPQIYTPGMVYYPKEDCYLWAVYRYEDPSETGYATELKSGEYRYVNADNQLALRGVPVEGKMEATTLDNQDEEQVYTITFAGTDTAYITHKASGTPIGYTISAQMIAAASPWLVHHDGDQTLFYASLSGKDYVLWLNIYDVYNPGTVYAGLIKTTVGSSPVKLLPVREAKPTAYTCHPECGVGIDEVTDERISGLEDERVLMRFGNYNLVIKNGKKYLIGNR